MTCSHAHCTSPVLVKNDDASPSSQNQAQPTLMCSSSPFILRNSSRKKKDNVNCQIQEE